MTDFEKNQKREQHLEKVMFDLWRRESGETNNTQMEHLKNCIRVAMSEVLTDKQRQCLTLYLTGYNQSEISQIVGIDKSGISRHINRALDKLLSRIKYATPRTLHVEAKVRKNLTRLYKE